MTWAHSGLNPGRRMRSGCDTTAPCDPDVAGVEAFTARKGQQLKKNFADSARALRARGASTAEQQLADGMLHRLSNDAGGPNGKNFRGPIFFSARQSNNSHGKAPKTTFGSKSACPVRELFWASGALKSACRWQKVPRNKKTLFWPPSPRPKGEKAKPQQNKPGAQHVVFQARSTKKIRCQNKTFGARKVVFQMRAFFVQAGQRAVCGTLQKVCTSNPTVKQQGSEPEKVVH